MELKEETVDGEVKNFLSISKDENLENNMEHQQGVIVKQNGMSEHSGIQQDLERNERKDSSIDGQNNDTLSEDIQTNTDTNADDKINANGEIIENNKSDENGSKDDEYGSDNNEEKILERTDDQSEPVSSEEQQSDNISSKSEMTKNEQNDIEPMDSSEKSEDSVSVKDDKLNDCAGRKIEPSCVPGFESEDSSEDSVDSSISNASETSSSAKKDFSISITDSINNKETDISSAINISKEELKETDKYESGSETVSDKPDNSDDASKNVDDKDVEKNETESDLTINKPQEKVDKPQETVDKPKESDQLKTNASTMQPVLQSATLPYMVPIPTVPYIIPQQQQTGYITKVGSQHIFVPMSGAAPSAGVGIHPMISAQTTSLTTSNVPVKNTTAAATEKPPDLSPKSSLEMIELMKWEIQNRVPDNYNWSVAFHPKKDELSSVTSFLLELGHDVVKEAVYKDIILIQTKKKEQGVLKESEIESLEKMKTVYDNTKKKVEHMEMKMLKCKHCKFQTESEVVMNDHKDHPHIEPPWDLQNGNLCCAICDFRTKQTAAFSFHMEAVHKAVAKMPEKPGQFSCEMCPLDLSTKNKLTKHRVKCMKTFKLNVNLQPYYHDVNFCMKTCYYKPKKPIPKLAKKPDPKPQASRQQPVRSTAPVVRGVNAAQVMGVRQTMMQPQFLPKAPPPLQRQPISITPIIRAPRPQQAFRQASQRPKTPVVRQMIQQQKQQSPIANTSPVRPPQTREMSGFEVCELCGGYVKDRQALRIHFYYAHKVEMPQTIFNRPTPPLTCDVCQSKFWTTQGLSKHKSTLRHYSTANNTAKTAPPNHKCFMCNRMVTNLFIHVEQSHGMTMKDLVAMKKCIMCGITASDRKQLEVHMSSLHGVLIKANDFLGPEKPVTPNKTPAPVQQKPTTPGAQKPTTPGTTATPNKGKSMVRNNLCVFCQIQFADNIQLTMHCIKIHATCSACGMVVASSKHLQNHHCKKMMRDCDICGLKKLAPDAYAVHIKKHVKPCSVKVDKMTDKAVITTKEDIKKNYKPAVISLDSDSGSESDVELVVDGNEKPENDDKDKTNKDVETTDSSNCAKNGANKQSSRTSKISKKISKTGSNEISDNEKENVVVEAPDTVEETQFGSDDKEKEVDGVDDSELEKEEYEGKISREAAENNDSDENMDESVKENIDTVLGDKDESDKETKSDSMLSSENEESESGSGLKAEVDQTETRKRKNSSEYETKFDENKRLKMECENDKLAVGGNVREEVSDSESRDRELTELEQSTENLQSQFNTDNNEVDNVGCKKRPHEDDDSQDSETESDQAIKHRKITEETE